MNVESLIERVLQTYAAASRYSDRGTAIFTVGAEETRIDFETSFERPDRFSFSFTAESTGADRLDKYSYSIESDGRVLRMVGDPALHSVQPSSLGLAVAALTGISMGCAHTVPNLLMPDVIDGRGLFEWSRRALGDPVTIDGASHLSIYLGEGSALMLVYVNEATLVVRRTEGPAPVKVTDYSASLTPKVPTS